MSAPKKSNSPKKAARPSYKMMVLTACATLSHFGRGVSRQAIAKYVAENYEVSEGSYFNTALRTALRKGIENGLLQHGDTKQRFKLTAAGRAERNPPKPKKRKKTVKKKKTTNKKKKAASRKKAAAKKSKKKKAANKSTKRKSAKKKTSKRSRK